MVGETTYYACECVPEGKGPYMIDPKKWGEFIPLGEEREIIRDRETL